MTLASTFISTIQTVQIVQTVQTVHTTLKFPQMSQPQVTPLRIAPTELSDVILTLVIGGIGAFLLAYLLTFAVAAFCRKVGWLDRPAARRVHMKAVPRLGGV